MLVVTTADKQGFTQVQAPQVEVKAAFATNVVGRITLLLHALTVPYPTPLKLIMFILFGRIRLAMCLPKLLVLKVVSRKEPFGLPNLL